MFKREKFNIKDTVEVWSVRDDGIFNELILKTCNNPSIFDKFLKLIGFKKFANDIIMDIGVQDVATFIYNRYNYIQNGVADTHMSDATLTNLISPLPTARVLATKGYDTTYITNDTILFTGVFTNNSGDTQIIKESGLFKDISTSASDVMFCRQTFSYSVLDGSTYGVIWKIVISRG